MQSNIILKIAKRPVRWVLDALLKLYVEVFWKTRRRLSRPAGLPFKLIVSLTSYPPRFSAVAWTLKSLLAQSVTPDAIMLWIAQEDIDQLPANVLKLRDAGIEIRLCEDLRSYKKIIPLLREQPNCFILTADDDAYYKPTWLSDFVRAYRHDNSEVLCGRANTISLNKNGEPKPYIHWQRAGFGTLSNSVLPTGVGGVFYPPRIFHLDVTRIDLFTCYCASNDDIWLYWMAMLNGAKFRLIGSTIDCPTWRGTQDVRLSQENVDNGGNDKAMAAMIFTYGFPANHTYSVEETLLPPKAITLQDGLMVLLLIVTTVVGLVSLVEVIARRLFIASDPAAVSCLVLNDASTGVRGKPGSVCVTKSFESEWTEIRINACGHRATLSCDHKTPGLYRIVLIGSSISEGFRVGQKQSFAALLPALLSSQTGLEIELYNEGMESGTPHVMDLQFDRVLAAQPDLILWPVSPWEIYNADATAFPDLAAVDSDSQSILMKGSWAKLIQLRDWQAWLSRHCRGFFMLQHFLFKNPSFYIQYSLSRPDPYIASMRSRPAADWLIREQRFEHYFKDMESRARRVRVPFAVAALPYHLQADLIARDRWPTGLNPYAFGEQVRSIVTRNGGIYLDSLKSFRALTDIHDGYFPVDQHLNAHGHAAVAKILAKELGGWTAGHFNKPPAVHSRANFSAPELDK